MKYYCEKCGKTYDNQDACFACEKKHQEEAERQQVLKEEKEARWKEVEEAINKAQGLFDQYLKDYKPVTSIHTIPLTAMTAFRNLF
ncbi:MAG: hypothetical protein K2F81_07700 [Ruminococcus sp.]|nr:hypothetical protein [Ruminococcus sp.]